jgi:GR25 family glycosyltransferase involved in LPS biosynthesis
MIKDYIDKTYIMNLDTRTDRWENIIKELKKIGISNYERFSSIKPNPADYPFEYINKLTLAGSDHHQFKVAALGSKLSHIEILKKARNIGYSQILMLEDDAEFRDDANEIFDTAMIEIEQNNINWDMLLLGFNHLNRPTKISDRLHKTNGSYTTHSYIIRKSIYDIVINNALLSGLELDRYYALEIHPIYQCYCIMPPLAWQMAGWSEVLQGPRTYEVLKVGGRKELIEGLI